MTKLLVNWLISALSLVVVANVIRGFQISGFGAALIAAIVIGFVNGTIGFVLKLITFPLSIITLGLFWFVINALMLYCVGWLLHGFHVDSFWWAFGGALIISIVSVPLNLITGLSRTKLEFRHHQNRRPPDGPGGSGPVIDV